MGLCFLTARPAEAQTACGEPDGADIIMSDIVGVQNYAPFNGIDAVSFGHVHCNLGDQPAAFMANTNAHPVFGFNMYRLKDGRMEQIGMSWLLHGFFALSGTQCGCSCTPTNGSTLGVGCSNSDTAGIQGQPLGLGPRFDIDAFAGNFPFPPSPGDPNSSGPSIYKRLQVKLADLNPQQNLGAQYYSEAFTISRSDALPGNGWNNYSHRPIAISYTSDNANFLTTGQIVREKPAIFAWQAAHPDVQITEVSVPDEGTFYLGARAAYVGDGFWDYEYALFNVNSDRAARAFQVPLPENVLVQNSGFHDVDYHSGEPVDLTDWDSQVLDQAIRWETAAFEEHPNANALRFGTMYNFRFRTNRIPVFGNVGVELFKPGAVNELFASTIVPSPDIFDCNFNGIDDSCDMACLSDGSSCDVAGCGLGLDVNSNGFPDECDLFGNVDHDSDVDLLDFTEWTACAQGPDVEYEFPSCSVFDANADLDVDLGDFRSVMNSYTGSGG